jgi:signal peptidase I
MHPRQILRKRAVLVAALLMLGAPLPAEPAKPDTPRLRTYVMPSSSMTPTLIPGDRMFVDMQSPDAPQRGDLVVIEVRKEQWLKRVAALPGDRIAIRQGVVVLNGQDVPQTAAGIYDVANEFGPPERARKSLEQFPGEARPHEILDLGSRRQDDYAEVVLGPGQYFLLGDNRDNSMDSRMPDQPLYGLGLVRREQILGRVLYRYWRRSEGWKRVDF